MRIFTSLKSKAGRVEEIQRAALANWRECFCGAEIVDMGEGRDFSQVGGGRSEVEGGRGVCAWFNADILFVRDEVVRLCAWMDAAREDFLIVGRRTDLLPGRQREVHRPSGMDYFFFRAGMFRDLPPTIMGRAYCDSALLAHCLRKGIRVIDASAVLTVTHQWHDYAHAAGGRAEVFGGEAAQANKRNNRLRDFGPHIADVGWKFEVERGERGERVRDGVRVVRKRVALLRRLGLWGLWNRLSRGGIGIWGIHEYVGKKRARFFTRSKIIQNYKNSNVVWKFNHLNEWETGIYTGFDFPCMWRGLREKKRTGENWTLYLWDPPALGHRDRFPPLRWAIDFVWRWFARRCDRLVLNIHPGLLGEMGIRVEKGEKGAGDEKGEMVGVGGKRIPVEFRMQDAFDDMALPCRSVERVDFEYDFGVLCNWTKAKGGPLMAKAMEKMPGKRCLWIGDCKVENRSDLFSTFAFTGTLPQAEAFEKLRMCRVLVVPYLNVPSLRWNYVLKLFEYLQLGRPIVASDNPGNVAIAKRFPGRITLFRSGDVNDLVNKLKSL